VCVCIVLRLNNIRFRPIVARLIFLQMSFQTFALQCPYLQSVVYYVMFIVYTGAISSLTDCVKHAFISKFRGGETSAAWSCNQSSDFSSITALKSTYTFRLIYRKQAVLHAVRFRAFVLYTRVKYCSPYSFSTFEKHFRINHFLSVWHLQHLRPNDGGDLSIHELDISKSLESIVYFFAKNR